MTGGAERDVAVKQAIYEALADTGHAPSSREVAATLGVPEPDVLAAFERLHRQRLLVPEPGDSSRIRMAPPFSGVPTTFRVRARDRSYFGNCVWDALGIAAALHADAIVDASDGHTGEPLSLTLGRDGPAPTSLVAHFAVPAARWWDDIIHT
jgi:DNA-binding transcriptional MocR family regulator